MVNGKRVRSSLKTRDVQRAARRLAEMEEEALGRQRKPLSDAIDASKAQHAGNADETKRKYKRILRLLTAHCARESVRYVDQIGSERLYGYALRRNK